MSFVRILSISQESQFERGCPYQYFLQRVKKIPGKDSPELRFGSACHSALETLHKAHRSGMMLPMDFLMRIFRKEYLPCRSTFAEFQARKLLGLYIDKMLPHINPLLVEEQFYLDIAPGAICTGVVDIYTTDRIIIDFKFRNKVKKDPYSLQEICYWLGMSQLTGVAVPREYWRITFVRTPDRAGRYRIVREVVTIKFDKAAPWFYSRMREFERDVNYARTTGTFHKNPRSRLCHPRWCPYYDTHCNHRSADSFFGEKRDNRRLNAEFGAHVGRAARALRKDIVT